MLRKRSMVSGSRIAAMALPLPAGGRGTPARDGLRRRPERSLFCPDYRPARAAWENGVLAPDRGARHRQGGSVKRFDLVAFDVDGTLVQHPEDKPAGEV